MLYQLLRHDLVQAHWGDLAPPTRRASRPKAVKKPSRPDASYIHHFPLYKYTSHYQNMIICSTKTANKIQRSHTVGIKLQVRTIYLQTRTTQSARLCVGVFYRRACPNVFSSRIQGNSKA